MRTQLPESTKHISPLLMQFKADLGKLYGSRLNSLILFGSYARGKTHSESDIDILVLLNEMESPYKEIDFMGDIKNDFLYNNEIVISTVPTSLVRFKKNAEPLYKNVKSEGILL